MFFLRFFFDRIFFPRYKRNLARILASLCPKDSYVLDFGCDDGSVAAKINEYNPSLKIVGVDIDDHRPSVIPKKTYSGDTIPYPDDTFDVVIASDVLHHTDRIPHYMNELKRVSRKYIIIKDHATDNPFFHRLIRFTDFISNVPYGIRCSNNFLSTKKWLRIFDSLFLEVVDRPGRLHFGFGITEKLNPVFKLAKRR